VIKLNEGIVVAMGRLFVCAMLVLGFQASMVNAAPAGVGSSHHPDIESEVLSWPTGNVVRVDVSTGLLINPLPQRHVVYDEIIRIEQSGWLRLYFGEVVLEKGSLIRVTSLLDDETMVLDEETLSEWNHTTAYFNGSAVRVVLEAAPRSTDNIMEIDYVGFFDISGYDRGDGCGICGNDDRTPESDNRFARLMPVGCSATVYNEDSCMVTAGHCLFSGSPVVQFNVPASNSNCSTNNPPVADQFPVLTESGVNGGVGNDYGAMLAGTNSSGETPYERYGAFVPLATSIPGSGTVSVTGYGVDDECTRSQTEQYHSGPISYTDSTTVVYDVDVTYGNSGSSILYNNAIIAVVTHCSHSCENYGTRVDISGFISARAEACDGEGPPPGECPTGEIEDCFGNCCPDSWVGDGYCDDGTYSWNGIPIYLNCDEFDCDGGDCPPESCGGGTGACCIGDSCTDGLTSEECSAFEGTYQGDDTNCGSVNCGGGGGCPAGEIEDCFGNCCPDFWVGDGYCDDGSYSWNGIPIYLNCDEFDCDGGDCPPESCGGGGGGTGACCIGDSCTDGLTSEECSAFEGTYQGDDTNCGSVNCGGGGDSTLDIAGMDSNDDYGSGVNVIATLNIPAGANITGVGWENVTLSAYSPSWGSEAGIMFHWESDGEPFAGYILIFDGEAAPGDYGPSTDFSDLTVDWNFSDADGVIEVEFFETYDDFPGETDGTWTGGEIYLTHDGDGGDGTGACCIGTDCVVFTAEECALFDGEYLGDDVPCESDTCGPPPCEGDINMDGTVGVNDLLMVIGDWGCTGDCEADINGDGVVGVTDLLTVIGAWGPC